MLVHIKTLSLWEVAHYWHDLDPKESTTHHIPLKVRNTLRILSMWFGKKVAYRIEQDKPYLIEILKKTPKYTARHYRKTFQKTVDNKLFGKRFLGNMFVSRSQLARQCVAHKEPLPLFWFPDNEKYPYNKDGDISDEVSMDGRYNVILVYDDTPEQTNEPDTEAPVSTTVSENALKAAQASHAPMNEVKDRFIQFFNEDGQNFSSKKAAAESFYDTLHELQEKTLFVSREAAVRTLLHALRSHLKKVK